MSSISNDFSNLQGVKTSTSTANAGNTDKTSTNGAVSQAQFLKLMTTQMTHQDPSKPMENGEFLTQMAQFGTVTGIQDLQKSFSEFSNSITSGQNLQAASLIGRSVYAPATTLTLAADKNVRGEIELTGDTNNLRVEISGINGGKIDTINIPGSFKKGSTVPLNWDGVGSDGKKLAPGSYKFQAMATVKDKNDKSIDQQLVTQLQTEVKSVSMGGGSVGVMVNLASGESMNFNKVKQVF